MNPISEIETITEPDIEPPYDSFDGIYIGSNKSDFIMPPNEYELSGLAEYMRKTGKSINQLSYQEINNFKFK